MSEYSAVPSTGKLKLKGVTDAKIDKKKKKKKKPVAEESHQSEDRFVDKSVVLRKLEDEDSKFEEESRQENEADRKEVAQRDEGAGERLKTEAEKRHDEQRRRRLEERLKREGVKTHKERVEELNRYLSNLSEHHDMPKIGPG